MKIPPEALPIINQMTNWQRNQWARSGYPADEAALKAALRRKHGSHPRRRRAKSTQ